jgi:glyoxylase-like metal-dependent hydrolase (beta-lactamase superfamily II)
VALRHGEVIQGDGWSVEAVHTPGHCSNHLCFAVREDSALLSGDHVMGWSTTVISPPDGDMGDYMRSLDLLLEREDRLLVPTHGPAIDDPKTFVHSLIAHRRERERQIARCLEQGVDRITDMVPRMYQGTASILYPAAARSVFAHMLHMLERGVVVCDGPPAIDARYRLA